jgi:hypothetical protein
MLRTSDIFDGPILTPEQFLKAAETFAFESLYLYKGFDAEEHDLFPELPIVADPVFANLVYIYGLIHGSRPGKVLLQGMSRVRGFKDAIHVAFEPLSKRPGIMSIEERHQSLSGIKRRLRHSIIVLAQRSGLEPFDPNIEVNYAEVLPGIQDSTSKRS